MAQSITPAFGLTGERDLFVPNRGKLQRIRVSAPVQLLMLVLMFALVGWAAYAAGRLVGAEATPVPATRTGEVAALAAAAELRARQIEQRQEVIAAMLAGEDVDPASLPETTPLATLPSEIAGPLARVEDRQAELAGATRTALEQRYHVTVSTLKKLGISPKRLAVGGPFEPVTRSDPTFQSLFNSWKKLDQLQDGAIAVPSDKPVKTAAFTSGFGVRSDPFQGRAAMHAGIDLAGAVGTPIYATADGVVLRSGWNSGGYGNLIEVDHGKGITTRYGHLSAVLVKPGQRVARGQQIGRMGSTGRSTGSHLHYEVRIDGRAVNPIPFMKSTDYLVAIQKRSGTHAMDQIALGGPKGGQQR